MKRMIEMMVVLPATAFALPVLVDSALKGVLLLAVILIAVGLLRTSSAALRHLVLTAAMLGLLVLPVLSLTLPGWRVLPAWAETRVAPSRELQPPSDHAAKQEFGSDFATADNAGDRERAMASLLHSQPDPTPGDPGWVGLAVWIWLIGGALFGLRLALSRIALGRLGRDADACADREQLALLGEMKSAMQVRRPVSLLIHPERAMPMTWGILKTRLLLPAESLAWESGRMRAVLLHELAHVKRRDCLTQLLVQSTCALHWFNPLAWVAARRIAAERERACDDLVLNSGVRASDYAEHLLRIATGYEDRPVTAAAALAMARKSSLEGRLTSILSERIDRRTITHRVAIAVACTLALLALPVAMMRAVAQDDPVAGEPAPAEVGGTITQVNDDWGFALVDIGLDDGLEDGDRLDVFRDGKQIAELKAISIKQGSSICEGIAPGQAKRTTRLAAGDEVRLRAREAEGEPDEIAKLVKEWAEENALQPYLELGADEVQQLEALLQEEPPDLKPGRTPKMERVDEVDLPLQRPRSFLMDPMLMPKRPVVDSLHLPDWRSNSAWQSITPYEITESLSALELDLGDLRIEIQEPILPADTADRAPSRAEPADWFRAARPVTIHSDSPNISELKTHPYPAYGRSLVEPWAEVVGEQQEQQEENTTPQFTEVAPGKHPLIDPWGNVYYIEKDVDQVGEGPGSKTRVDLEKNKALIDRLLEEKSEDWFTKEEDLLELTKKRATRGKTGNRPDVAKVENPGSQIGDIRSRLADQYLSTYPKHPELWVLNLQRQSLQADRLKMGRLYGAKHPKMMKLDTEISSVEAKIAAVGTRLANPAPDKSFDTQFSRLAEQFDKKTKAREQLLASGLGHSHPSVVAIDKQIEVISQAIIALDKRGPAQTDKAPFPGVGVILRSDDDGGFSIMSLLDGAPAERSGQVRPNDRIVAFAEGPEGGDGKWNQTKGLSMEEFIKRLRGKAGAAVRLEIIREADGKESRRRVTLVREILELNRGAAPPQSTRVPGTDPRQKPAPAKPEAGEPVLIQLTSADAAEAKKVIDGILRGSRRGRVIVDAETNSLVYIGDAATLKLVRSAVEWLEE
ncbi:MAG: M56 family metallopeptidase [Verrucomicrobiales bacterium]